MSIYSIFGAKILPKFTNDFKNILKVSSKKEIFFDVFECQLNGENIIVEKIGHYENAPIVRFEIKDDGKAFNCEALLVIDKENDLYLNENNLEFSKNIKTPIVEKAIIEEVKKTIPNDILHERRVQNISDKIVAESEAKAKLIQEAKLEEYNQKKQEVNRQAEQFLSEKAQNIKDDLNEQYLDFLFINDNKVKKLIESKVKNINDVIDQNINNTLIKINESSNSNKQDFLKILSENISKIDNNIKDKIGELNDSIDIFTNANYNKVKKLDETINFTVKSISGKIENFKTDTLKTVVEKVAENKTEIEKSLKNTILEINEKANLKSSEAKQILSAELANINEKLNIFSQEEDKKYKQLLENLNNLNKVEVKEILSEKISDSQINSLKLDIKQQFQNEMMSIRRLIELSSGGGSVAKQFADGGTMNGDLNVTGELKADTIIATTLLSASTMDINFELSGFSSTGNLSANGNLYVTENINLSGDLSASGSLRATGSNPNYFAGNVGIGNNSPAKNLHITHSSSPTIRFARDLSYYWDIGHTGSDFQFTSQIPGVVMHMNYDGNVGIATINPNEKLTVAGNISASGSINAAGNVGIGLSSTPSEALDMNGHFRLKISSANRTAGKSVALIKSDDKTAANLRVEGPVAVTHDLFKNSGVDNGFADNSNHFHTVQKINRITQQSGSGTANERVQEQYYAIENNNLKNSKAAFWNWHRVSKEVSTTAVALTNLVGWNVSGIQDSSNRTASSQVLFPTGGAEATTFTFDTAGNNAFTNGDVLRITINIDFEGAIVAATNFAKVTAVSGATATVVLYGGNYKSTDEVADGNSQTALTNNFTVEKIDTTQYMPLASGTGIDVLSDSTRVTTGGIADTFKLTFASAHGLELNDTISIITDNSGGFQAAEVAFVKSVGSTTEATFVYGRVFEPESRLALSDLGAGQVVGVLKGTLDGLHRFTAGDQLMHFNADNQGRYKSYQIGPGSEVGADCIAIGKNVYNKDASTIKIGYDNNMLNIDSAGIDVAGTVNTTGNITAPRLITNEIQCVGTTTGTAQPITYDAKEHRFRDYDETPNNLMVIKKVDGVPIGKVGINHNNPASALHVVGGHTTGGGIPNEALRVVGSGLFTSTDEIGLVVARDTDNTASTNGGHVLQLKQDVSTTSTSNKEELNIGFIGSGGGGIYTNSTSLAAYIDVQNSKSFEIAVGGKKALSLHPTVGYATFSNGASFNGDITITDKIIHSGDDSAIRFPANDTVTVETAGVERLRVSASGLVTIAGDLQVNGITTTVNQTNLDVSDNIIGLNRGSSTNANDSGIIIERGSTGDNAAILWDESADEFVLGTTTADASSTGNITVTPSPLLVDSVKIESGPTLTKSGAMLKVSTDHGYVAIGPSNTSFSHFTTDRDRYYFNKKLIIDEGIVSAYNDHDLILTTGSSPTTSSTGVFIKNTTHEVGINNNAPSEALDVTGNIKASGSITGANLVATAAGVKFSDYAAVSRSTDPGTANINPVQNFRAGTNLDTLTNLCVDSVGNVVRGSQEATWTFTRTQLNALTTSKVTLLSTPGAGKCIIVEDSNWLIEVDLTKAAQSTACKLVCEIANGQTQYKVATQITAANLTLIAGHIKTTNTDAFGLYSRDVPQLDRISRFNEPMTIRAIGDGGTQFPDNFVSVKLKVKYRVFDSNTF